MSCKSKSVRIEILLFILEIQALHVHHLLSHFLVRNRCTNSMWPKCPCTNHIWSSSTHFRWFRLLNIR